MVNQAQKAVYDTFFTTVCSFQTNSFLASPFHNTGAIQRNIRGPQGVHSSRLDKRRFVHQQTPLHHLSSPLFQPRNRRFVSTVSTFNR